MFLKNAFLLWQHIPLVAKGNLHYMKSHGLRTVHVQPAWIAWIALHGYYSGTPVELRRTDETRL